MVSQNMSRLSRITAVVRSPLATQDWPTATGEAARTEHVVNGGEDRLPLSTSERTWQGLRSRWKRLPFCPGKAQHLITSYVSTRYYDITA